MHPRAEGAQVSECLLRGQGLLPQLHLLLLLSHQGLASVVQQTPPRGEFFQADDRSLIGIDEALLFTRHAPQARSEFMLCRLLLRLSCGGQLSQLPELPQQMFRLSE